MNHKRSRYQEGSLTIEQRQNGPDVWVYRWRETLISGVRVKRKRIVGTRELYPSKTAATRAISALRLEINSEGAGSIPLSIAEVAQHFIRVELSPESSKTQKTKDVYNDHLERLILPKWGGYRLGDVRAVAVETWLESLDFAPSTKAKTRNVMGALFQHAMRHEWVVSNPIRLVRQSAKPVKEFSVLTAEEISALLLELPEPSQTIVLLAAVTGLRRGELFGLKWQDVDFDHCTLHIQRSVVDQVEGPPKTIGSRRPLPMTEVLSKALSKWKEKTEFNRSENWVFASPQALGRKPYWPSAILTRHILPAAKRAGIAKHIGWHTFRRTLATLLHSSGESVKTTQELLRHASPTMTLGTYAQAVSSEKRAAQINIAAKFVTLPQPITDVTEETTAA